MPLLVFNTLMVAFLRFYNLDLDGDGSFTIFNHPKVFLYERAA